MVVELGATLGRWWHYRSRDGQWRAVVGIDALSPENGCKLSNWPSRG